MLQHSAAKRDSLLDHQSKFYNRRFTIRQGPIFTKVAELREKVVNDCPPMKMTRFQAIQVDHCRDNDPVQLHNFFVPETQEQIPNASLC